MYDLGRIRKGGTDDLKYRHVVLLLAAGLTLAILVPGVILAQPRIPADHVGRTTCTACHTVGAAGVGAPGGVGLPADHQGRADATCTGCHQAAAAAPAAQPTPTTAPAKPAATPTVAPAAPAAQPTPTAAPAKPAATPAPAPAALPRTGGFPAVPVALGGGAFLAALGWTVRRLLKR